MTCASSRIGDVDDRTDGILLQISDKCFYQREL